MKILSAAALNPEPYERQGIVEIDHHMTPASVGYFNQLLDSEDATLVDIEPAVGWTGFNSICQFSSEGEDIHHLLLALISEQYEGKEEYDERYA